MTNLSENRHSAFVDSENVFFSFLAAACRKIENKVNVINEFSNVIATSQDAVERVTCARQLEAKTSEIKLLVSDLKYIIKITTGMDEGVSGPVDVDELLRQTVQVKQSFLCGGNVILKYMGGYGKPFVINTVAAHLTKIVNNLLTNSINRTDEGSINVGFKIKGCDSLYFYVEDTGTSIPKDKLKSTFEHFVRLDSNATETGLGLTICKILVKGLGGEIGAESEWCKGSKFWFTIPYVVSDKTSAAIMEPEPDVSEAKEVKSEEKPKILIAEDDSANYFLFESILKNNYSLVRAKNGAEALGVFKKETPALVIMDVKMPVMDGFQATAEIRKIDKTTPIVAATAYALPEVEERLYAAGVNGYLVKPLSPSDLKNKIHEMLNGCKENN
ncbi:MAG: hybrid sensor histidine kinase/response regulator [Bacteroidales bacterium]|nr:hybrid sensor histidine kinase/response regulator [Bacteroidales bacterium]MDD3911110.1 hybrid sensor histidine kinase/response regulator [Bacteroidales bacterium]MDD4420027.1 hybrid sensor histidine kinase/response regulator [Bacteroidales bacterium]